MKKLHNFIALIFLNSAIVFSVNAQNQQNFTKNVVTTGNTSFDYYASKKSSETLVILFHDWFGVSELSYEIGDKLINKGYDALIIDLYKGKSAKTNQEAGALMNAIDQANVWNYIDRVITESNKKYDKIILWGFSLGTVPASNNAIKHADKIDGLILFYGNVTGDKDQLKKLSFPTLMVMGSKDNPKGAIDYFNSVNEIGGNARLFIYPNAKHAFAQKLFNNGSNFDQSATNASLNVAFDFLNEL